MKLHQGVDGGSPELNYNWGLDQICIQNQISSGNVPSKRCVQNDSE